MCKVLETPFRKQQKLRDLEGWCESGERDKLVVGTIKVITDDGMVLIIYPVKCSVLCSLVEDRVSDEQ